MAGLDELAAALELNDESRGETRMGEKVAYTVLEAAEAVSLSHATIRRAIHTTNPNSFPPPLRAKQAGGPGGKYLISVDELKRWFESLPDV